MAPPAAHPIAHPHTAPHGATPSHAERPKHAAHRAYSAESGGNNTETHIAREKSQMQLLAHCVVRGMYVSASRTDGVPRVDGRVHRMRGTRHEARESIDAAAAVREGRGQEFEERFV